MLDTWFLIRYNSYINETKGAYMKTYQQFCENLSKELFELIEQKGGLLEWKQAWTKEGALKLPRGNQHQYKGHNMFALLLAQMKYGYGSNYWLTFNQIQKLGGQVKKGAKANKVIYWNVIESEQAESEENKDNEDNKKIICKAYAVFNLEQTTLDQASLNHFEEVETIDALLKRHQVEISHFGNSAYYSRNNDQIVLPPQTAFLSPENYYAVVLHELVHWTAGKNRLSRDCANNYQNDEKARAEEELVAEIGSLFLTTHFGIKGNLEMHASYVNSWKINLTKKEIIRAVKLATEAFNMLINTKGGNNE